MGSGDTTMQNRRKINRRYLLYFVRVYDATTHQQIGNLVDITPQGAMIVGQSPIPEEIPICIQLELTPEISEKPFLEFQTKSKWCHPDLEPSLYNIGFEILELSAQDSRTIQKIVETFGFRDNEPAR
jgi:hypothetical protein